MKNINLDGMVIGEGKPKICVPIVAEGMTEVVAQAEKIAGTEAELVEFRIDYLKENASARHINEITSKIKEIIKRPVILTFRTAFEGGEKEISREEYKNLLVELMENNEAEIFDVELFSGDALVNDMVNKAHENGKFIIMSNHDFDKTPMSDDISERLFKMEKLGADIAKIAVMPQSKKDLLTLLDATVVSSDKLSIPVVTMSMGKLGMISRLAGEVFGSAITFGSVLKSSAPGQVEVSQLKSVLDVIHNNLV